MRKLTRLQEAVLTVMKRERRSFDPREMVGAIAGHPSRVRLHPSATAKAMRKLCRVGMLVAYVDKDIGGVPMLKLQRFGNPVLELMPAFRYRLCTELERPFRR